MICPNCGEDVTDDVPFCPHCGHNLKGRKHKRKLRFVLMDVQDDMRFRHLASAMVIAVVIVAVLSVLLALGSTDTSDGPSRNPLLGEPSDDAIVVSETAFIELGGGFEDGTMGARMDGSGQLTIWLSDGSSEGFDTYTWILRDENTNTSQTITKNTPSLVWVSPYVGTYTVTIHCTSSTGESAVYTGMFEYMGDSHVQYSFAYGGSTYAVYVDVTLSEYLACLHDPDTPDVVRHSPDVTSGARFVTADGAVATLAQRLLSAFVSNNPSSPTDGPEYADFVLSFVQSCFSIGSDTYYHSTSTYWAYPAETLYTAVGDSGDLAVLAASLLRASGFDAGIASIDGQAFAIVSLDDYEGPETVPKGMHVLSVDRDGGSYLFCSVDEGPTPVGCVDDAYGYERGRFTYFGKAADENSGMAIP